MDNENNQNEQVGGLYQKAVVVLTVVLGLLGVYTVYTVFTTDIEWGFKINWNCFKSPFFPVLAVIGFFLQFLNWQHMSMESWIGTKGPNDSDYKWERNHDIIESMFGGCLVPLLSHLLIIPCLYGAAMWYAIMGLVHVLGKLSPFFITALVAALIFFYYRWTTGFSAHKYRVVMLLALTIVAAAVLGGTAYYMRNPSSISSSSETIGLSSIGTCHISGTGVNLRQGPGTEFNKIGVQVSSGESYPLLGEEGDWVKIDYNGSPAWLSSKFCTLIYDVAQGEGMDDDDPGCWTGDEAEPDIYNEGNPTSDVQEMPSIYEQVSPQSNTLSPTEVIESPVPVVREEQTSPSDIISEREDDRIHNSAEQQAEFPGGMTALMTWLSANVRYPESAQQNDVQGRVVVKFIVEKDGSITNAQVIRSVDNDLDKEALRVVSKMPKWTPGKNGGIPVRSYFTIPVNFRLKEQ